MLAAKKWHHFTRNFQSYIWSNDHCTRQTTQSSFFTKEVPQDPEEWRHSIVKHNATEKQQGKLQPEKWGDLYFARLRTRNSKILLQCDVDNTDSRLGLVMFICVYFFNLLKWFRQALVGLVNASTEWSK